MADVMTRLVKQQVKIIKRAKRVRSAEKVAKAIEDIERDWFNRDIRAPSYAAGYLRGVAETTGITIRELLENM